MFAEFIDRPVAGSFPEKHFGKTTPYAMWVKLMDKQYQEWVGSFARGWEDYSTLIILEKDGKTFVVANGNGYLIDTTGRALLNDIELSGIKTAITDMDRKKIIFCDGLFLKEIDFDGQVSMLLDQYYFDDIELTDIKDNILYARYWYYQRNNDPFLFEMDLNTKEIKKDTYNDQNYDFHKPEIITQKRKETILNKIASWFKS